MTSSDDFEQVMLKLADQWDADGKIGDAAAVRKVLALRKSYHAAEERLRAAEEQVVEAIDELAELASLEADLQKREAELATEKFFLRIINTVNHEFRENPLFVWGEILTYNLAEPLPEWVRMYLEEVATSLFELAAEGNQSPKKLTARVASALKLSQKQWNAFEDLRSYEKELGYVNVVDSITGKRKDAVADAAQDHGFSPRTGSRYLKRMREYERRLRELVMSFGAPSNDTKQ